MRTRTGTGYVVALLLAFALLCTVGLVAQDKILTVGTGVNNNVASSASVNCSAFASDGVTCIAGQYYRGDNTVPSAVFNSTATATSFGAWTTAPAGTTSNGCIGCHHSSVNGVDLGGGYLAGGHKNIMRKVVPGQPLFASDGNVVSTVVDHGTGVYTIDWTTGALTGVSGGFFSGQTASYLIGYTPEPDVYGYGSTSTNLPVYGSCGRCHSTGYRFDDNGPEPTKVTLGTPNTYTKMTSTEFSRTPAGGKGTVSSWYLSGIQCERCHKADMQYDASVVNPTYNSGTKSAPVWTPTAGRVNHLDTSVQVDASGVDIANCVWNAARSRWDCPTKPVFVAGDFNVPTVNPVLQTQSASVPPTSSNYFSGRAVPKLPGALLCAECHQAYATYTAKTTGQNGEIHPTPLPGFEDLAPVIDTTKFTTTKDAKGQFSATFACSVSTITTATPNYYDACIAAGGTVAYAPGGMSHGAATTILNSPHARVTGYVDTAKPGTADSSLTIKGGTLTTGLLAGQTVTGKFNTFFASEAGKVAGSCMGCHNVHGYLEGYVETPAKNVQPETLKSCTACHASHANPMAHPVGNGTPYAALAGTTGTGTFGAQESCSTCHLSKKTGTEYHFLRINEDPTYSTFPTAAQYYKGVGSGQYGKLNTYPETYTDPQTYQQKTYPAVGLDVDIACGQCHTGGDGVKNPYGITPYAGDNADGSGFVAPRPYSRAFLAAKAVQMHATNAAVPTFAINGNAISLPMTGGPATITISSNQVSEGSPVSIFYTTDGTTPTVTNNSVAAGTTILCASNPCNVAISKTTTLLALASGPQSYGFTPSSVTGGTYGIQTAPTPTIAPTGANLTWSATLAYPVKLSDVAGSVCYTTDGSIPVVTAGACVAPAVSVPTNTTITINKSMVIKAVGFGASYGTSNVATATFTVKPATPTWSNVAPAKYPGTYVGAQQALLNDADPNATICYTTNGATPVVPCNGTSVAPGTLIPVGSSMTIKAIAIDGTTASTATSGTFVIK